MKEDREEKAMPVMAEAAPPRAAVTMKLDAAEHKCGGRMRVGLPSLTGLMAVFVHGERRETYKD